MAENKLMLDEYFLLREPEFYLRQKNLKEDQIEKIISIYTMRNNILIGKMREKIVQWRIRGFIVNYDLQCGNIYLQDCNGRVAKMWPKTEVIGLFYAVNNKNKPTLNFLIPSWINIEKFLNLKIDPKMKHQKKIKIIMDFAAEENFEIENLDAEIIF